MWHFGKVALDSGDSFITLSIQFLRSDSRILSDLSFYPFIKIVVLSVTLGIILGIILRATLGITLSIMVSDTPHYENVPFEVPEKWEWTCMAEVNEYNSASVDPSRSPDDEFELYSIPSYETGMPEFVKGKDISSSKKSVSRNDLLLCKINPHLNRAWIVSHYKEDIPCIASSEWIIFRNSAIHPQYLSFCFTSLYFKDLMLSNVSGVGGSLMRAQPAIVYKYLFPLPPHEEQKRIVAAIKQWFSLIDTLESAKEDLQTSIAQAKSKILDLAIHGKLVPQDTNDEPAIELLKRINPKFTPCDNAHDANQLPDSWCWTTLGSIFQHNTGKALNKSDSHEGLLKPYLTTSNVYWNCFDFTEVKEMFFKNSELDKCTVTKGDLLVCEGGDIGRASIWNYDYDICIQNHIHRLRAKGDLYQILYLYVLMLYKWKDRIHGKGIGLQGLSSGLLDKLVVPLPPYKEQHRIVAKIEELFAVLDEIQKSIEA